MTGFDSFFIQFLTSQPICGLDPQYLIQSEPKYDFVNSIILFLTRPQHLSQPTGKKTEYIRWCLAKLRLRY